MLVLLPPSETKRDPSRRARPLDLEGLSFPELTPVRARVLASLVRASAAPDAADRLDVGPGLAHLVARNVGVREAPAAPALELYTGVLYDALGWETLSPAARRRGARRLVVGSALWGALRPADRVPAYRLSMTGRLDVGPLAGLWRPVLGPALAAAAGRRGVVVDCRSAGYAAAAPAGAGPTARRTVAVRVLREHDGRRSVVSHLAKHTRGEVARHLLESGDDPARPQELAEVLAPRWPVELTRQGGGWVLDVVLRDQPAGLGASTA